MYKEVGVIATTRLISMHQNKGKTIASCLQDRTDYAKNPDKTNEGELLSAYACEPRTVQGEFMLSKKRYEEITGRTQKNNVIAYQIRQSFKPNEVTAELANKIGYELGMRFTKGNHAFIVATHIDKAHIHNHIIFNSTSLDATKKFRDFLGSGKALAKVSDIICLENGLSIIENPKKSKAHYGKWLGDKKPLNHSDRLRDTIDNVLSKKPQSFDDFLRLMKEAGYEIKQGKHISFKNSEQKKFIRLRSLGDKYSEEYIKNMISDITVETPKNITRSIDLLIDIDAKLSEGKNGGYAYWSKIENAKRKAKTINYLREHNLNSYEELEIKTDERIAKFNELSDNIKIAEKRLDEIKMLKVHIFNYRKTRDIYTNYKRAGYSKKFYAEYEKEILLHKASKKAFDELGVKKLPTIKALDIEFQEVLAHKKKLYATYKDVRKEMQDLVTTKQNVDSILNDNEVKNAKEKSQDRV